MENKNLKQEGIKNKGYLFREADIIRKIEEDKFVSACLELNPNLINKESFYKKYYGGRR